MVHINLHFSCELSVTSHFVQWAGLSLQSGSPRSCRVGSDQYQSPDAYQVLPQ